MAFNVNANNATPEKEKTYINLNDWDVTDIRLITNTFITFTLRGKTNGVSLYGMRLFESKDGYRMIRCPQTKYIHDGEERYSNQYAVYMYREDEEQLMETIIGKLNEQKEK